MKTKSKSEWAKTWAPSKRQRVTQLTASKIKQLSQLNKQDIKLDKQVNAAERCPQLRGGSAQLACKCLESAPQ